jgi:hypothetical protein
MMGGSTVIAPTAKLLALTWGSLVSADIPAAKIALEANVEAWVLETGEPGVPLRQPDIEDAGQVATGVVSVSLTDPMADADPGQYGLYTTFTHIYT